MKSRTNFNTFDDQILSAFESDKQQLVKIKQQNRILGSLNDKVSLKDQEIQSLKKQLRKFQKNYEDAQRLKATVSIKQQDLARKQKQNQILTQQVSNLLKENQQMREQLLCAEKLKHEFVKQRNLTDKRHRDIEQTFRQYQEECKNREKSLVSDLERSQRQIKDLNQRLQQLQIVTFQNQQLKSKLTNQAYSASKSRQRQRQRQRQRTINNNDDYKDEVERLRQQLNHKQAQLQRSKSLNHQLSIEFDKSVNKICEFERQLSFYRKENHELKKTLSLFVEREQYEKMHKNRDPKSESEESWSEQEQESPQSSQRPF